MSRRRAVSPLVALAVVWLTGALLTTGLVAAAPAEAGSAAVAVDRRAADTGPRVRHVTLKWRGSPGRAQQHKTVSVPGIGELTLTCRPDLTQISLHADDRSRETQMWMAKYEDKSYGRAVAVKTVRIYRFANANDDGTGGTGNPQHEGLNQRGGKNGVENYEKGYAHGIISQRPGRNQPAAGVPLEPVTTFDLDWYWNGFDYPAKYRFCQFDLTLETKAGQPLGVDWHGDDDAVGNQFQQVYLPSLGYLQLRCEPGRDGNQLISLVPDDPDLKAYVEIIQGEGRVEDHVDTRNRVVDRSTGKLGPLPIPRNGMMRIFFQLGKATYPYILSSYQVTNNDQHPDLNTCEIAMGAFPR